MHIDALKAIVGVNAWSSDPVDLEPRITEWRGTVVGATPLVLFPANTEQVSALVKCCAAAKIGIVPQGGNTGMCAGAVPDNSGTQVILSLARMNAITAVDPDNFSMQVEAGCILANIQEEAQRHNRFFALSLGAEGSCQIGGNLSTNAGGINVIRYGTARAQVLGLEAVLADGTIVNSLRALRKDTAGYDLKQLFIGSEGTLGIITAATLKLFPQPAALQTAMVSIATPGCAVRLLAHLRNCFGDSIEAFELISNYIFELIEKHVPNSVFPLHERAPWYVLISAAVGANTDAFEADLMAALDSGIALDAVIAKNTAEASHLWKLRHSISEAERAEAKALKHDISVPLSKMEEFLERGEEMLAYLVPDAQLIAFGHVGDGNLHYNVALGETSEQADQVSDSIYELVTELGGSISAEHGIGSVKREYLARYRSKAEISLMKTLKTALDPDNILNPGKVI